MVRFILLSIGLLMACAPGKGQPALVKNVGNMTTMGAEGFTPHIRLDTLTGKAHLFGLGPLNQLQGELTVLDGVPYNVRVDSRLAGIVGVNWQVTAPFFVYAQVEHWQRYPLNATTQLTSLNDLEKAIDQIVQQTGRDAQPPFPFRLVGRFSRLTTHVVTPRSETLEGYIPNKKQIDYPYQEITGEFIGFYSQQHQGIYTHRDSRLHVHFVSEDRSIMGHVDQFAARPENLTLYLPDSTFTKPVTIQTTDTDFSKGRLGYRQQLSLPDLVKFHGHLCDGLVEGMLALQEGINILYPDGIVDRTNTRIVSKSSPCLTDAAIFLTGGRYQYNTFYVDNQLEGLFMMQRIDNHKAVIIRRKPAVKPAIIDQLGQQASQGRLSPCGLDSLRRFEDEYTQFLLKADPKSVFDVTEVTSFRWQPKRKQKYQKTDVVNKAVIECR